MAVSIDGHGAALGMFPSGMVPRMALEFVRTCLFITMAAALGCWIPPQDDEVSPRCDLELRESGWVLSPPESTPRQEDPVGAEYGVFFARPPDLSQMQFRAHATAISAAVSGRPPAPEAWEEMEGRDEVRSLDAEGLLVSWNAGSGLLDVLATEAFSRSEEEPIGEAEAYRQFRCVVARLERARLISPGTIPVEGARMGKTWSASMVDGRVVESKVVGYNVRANRVLAGVIAPQVSLSVWLQGSGRLAAATLQLLEIAAIGPPQREVPLGPSFQITRAMRSEDVDARFVAEANAYVPGGKLRRHTSSLMYRRGVPGFGDALVPMHTFYFSYENVLSRGGWQWSYRIDDPVAPRWEEWP